MQSSVPARVGTWVVALVVGTVYGLAGTIAHAYQLGWFPLGLVLAIVGCAALLVAVSVPFSRLMHAPDAAGLVRLVALSLLLLQLAEVVAAR